MIYLISACQRSEGQLQAPRFLLQVLGASTSYVEYECRLDRTSYLRLSSWLMASPSSWHRKLDMLFQVYLHGQAWWSLCRTFGSRTIVKFTSLVTLWYGIQAQCASLFMSRRGDCWSCVLRGDTGTLIAVRNVFLILPLSCILRHCVAKVMKYDSLIGFLFIGWGLHYFPFFLMRRQLFLHHYFPALYFAILLSCVLFDLVTSTLRPRTRLQIAAVLVILAIWNYQHLSPLIYGNPWTRSKCQNAKWLKTWDFGWYVH